MQCEKQIAGDVVVLFDTAGGYHSHLDIRQCKRKATVGEKYCFQHGGGKCNVN